MNFARTQELQNGKSERKKVFSWLREKRLNDNETFVIVMLRFFKSLCTSSELPRFIVDLAKFE